MSGLSSPLKNIVEIVEYNKLRIIVFDGDFNELKDKTSLYSCLESEIKDYLSQHSDQYDATSIISIIWDINTYLLKNRLPYKIKLLITDTSDQETQKNILLNYKSSNISVFVFYYWKLENNKYIIKSSIVKK